MLARSIHRGNLPHPRGERLFHHHRHVLGIRPNVHGHQKSRLDCLQHPIRFLQVAPIAHGSHRKCEHFSEPNGMWFIGFDVEKNCPLDGWLDYFLRNGQDYLEPLRQMSERFCVAELKINPTKCESFRTRVPFLGHIISKKRLEADPEKLAAVENFPNPTSPKLMRTTRFFVDTEGTRCLRNIEAETDVYSEFRFNLQEGAVHFLHRC